MQISYSFIIPVYNRPDEIMELLTSFVSLESSISFEVVIVEDGSTRSSESIVKNFKDRLDIEYYFKNNTGPGDSRNYGMSKAKGNYFIILDSDCLLPTNYLDIVNDHLILNYVDCFGGPDAAHPSFTTIQKSINFSMTSILTTGGIRGGKNSIDKFQPRSFNMGISKKAFIESKGFGTIHPGEDPDLTFRLWKLGFKTSLIKEAYVFHKRRISWAKFYNQVNKFGKVRPILNTWHPETKRITYWLPSLFIIGLLIAIVQALIFQNYGFLIIYGFYFLLLFIVSLFYNSNFLVALNSIIAVIIQFSGYGLGFIKSIFVVGILKKSPEKYFPELFFKTNDKT